jgi:hypothetical protein
MLNINYSTGRNILKTYKAEGRMKRKTTWNGKFQVVTEDRKKDSGESTSERRDSSFAQNTTGITHSEHSELSSLSELLTKRTGACDVMPGFFNFGVYKKKIIQDFQRRTIQTAIIQFK